MSWTRQPIERFVSAMVEHGRLSPDDSAIIRSRLNTEFRDTDVVPGAVGATIFGGFPEIYEEFCATFARFVQPEDLALLRQSDE